MAYFRAGQRTEVLVTASSVCLPFLSLAGLPEPNTAGRSSDTADVSKEGGNDEVLTPTRPRTTEDLFAAIHRYVKLLSCLNVLYNFFFPDRPLCFPEVLSVS